MFLLALFLFVLFPAPMLVLFGPTVIFGEWWFALLWVGIAAYFIMCWIDDWRGRRARLVRS